MILNSVWTNANSPVRQKLNQIREGTNRIASIDQIQVDTKHMTALGVGKINAACSLLHSIFAVGFVGLLLANASLFSVQVQAQRKSQRSEKTNTSPPRSTGPVSSEAKPIVSQTFTQGGVAVKFSIEPIASADGRKLVEGSEVRVRFEITETNAGKALTNLRPTAWMDLRGSSKAPDARGCREKVQSLLQANFTDKAEVDLNNYFILALNHEPNISVIDPFSGLGTTKLYNLVALESPGEDWILSRDQKRLYVSMPLINQVAIVDTASWRVVANVDAGIKPARLVLQQDQRYLWVGNDSPELQTSGVTVIDTRTMTAAAHLNTGSGHHEISFTNDDRYAFITNKQAGTLSVVDVRTFARIKDVQIGPHPAALAFSSLSRTVYVANEGDGEVVAVDGVRHEILTRMKTQPGAHALRFMPGDRYGFVVNRATDSVSIFDVSTNQMLQRIPVDPAPDQVTFTTDFAYIRSNGSEFVTMINLRGLGKGTNELAVSRFPSGQKAPRESPYTSLADMVIAAPEPGAVLVANPADKMIYFYTEGMAAPMGNFQNYRRDPRAVLVLDKSLRETAPGIYTNTVKLPGPGFYDVPFVLDSPRLVSCFDFAVEENPALPKNNQVAIKIQPLSVAPTLKVGESYRLRFKVFDTVSNQPNANLDDVGVLVFLAPGIWQERAWAKSLGEGVYEVGFIPPQPGVYYVFFQCPSLGVKFNQIPSLHLVAIKDSAATSTQ
jgi:YVTN family beta-propeller protein